MRWPGLHLMCVGLHLRYPEPLQVSKPSFEVSEPSSEVFRPSGEVHRLSIEV